MNNFLIRTNETKDVGLKVTNEIIDFLKAQGKSVQTQLMNEAMIKGNEQPLPFELKEKPDCVIVLGGDGTMLRAARDFVDVDVPLLGVNLGTLGYLTEVEKTSVVAALTKLLSGDYQIEERMMLEGTLKRDGKEERKALALNDIVVSKSIPLQAIYYDIYVNGQFLKSYGADGVIISTPTGSTGYNLSAGGPIVEPGAFLLVLTPICPHTLNSRSIILSSDDVIRIVITTGKNGCKQQAEAMADGAFRMSMTDGDSFELRRSGKRTKIIKLSEISFLEVLHKKMN